MPLPPSRTAAPRAWDAGRFARSIVPVTDINGMVMLDRDETMRPSTSVESLAQAQPPFEMMGSMGFDSPRWTGTPPSKRSTPPPRGQRSGIVDGAGADAVGHQGGGRSVASSPAPRCNVRLIGSEPTIMLIWPHVAGRAEGPGHAAGMADIDIDW